MPASIEDRPVSETVETDFGRWINDFPGPASAVASALAFFDGLDLLNVNVLLLVLDRFVDFFKSPGLSSDGESLDPGREAAPLLLVDSGADLVGLLPIALKSMSLPLIRSALTLVFSVRRLSRIF